MSAPTQQRVSDNVCQADLNRVISCFRCGAVLAVYTEGDRVPATPHTCQEDWSC